jgi:cysteine-rich repeat protein
MRRWNIFGTILVAFIAALSMPQWFGSVACAQTYEATTTVYITICGNGNTETNEVCDDGTNSGDYGTSTATRNCNPLCLAYGPYCGDAVLQPFFGEECDDGNNTAGDLCSAVCVNEADPVDTDPGSGGGGGGGGSGDPDGTDDGNVDIDADTVVAISGRAYPNATVTILKDGEVEGVVEADSNADFDFLLGDPTPGTATFGFWAKDSAGRNSTTFTTTFQVIQNAVTNISNVFLPPTIAVTPIQVPPGGSITAQGATIPNGSLKAHVNNSIRPTGETIAAQNGLWQLTLPTTGLTAEQFHTIKARFESRTASSSASGFSQSVSFYVGTRAVDPNAAPSGADLNGDGRVNLVDFSILLFNWNTPNAAADLSRDGVVNLTDFSILLFNWTG